MPGPAGVPRANVIALLAEGHSNREIGRRLHTNPKRVARIRAELELPRPAVSVLTLDQKWASLVRPVDGGHLEWTGTRATRTGTPVLKFRGVNCSPAAFAFGKRRDRPAQGYVKAECGYAHCVAPDHVNDEAGRQQARRELRAARGLGDAPTKCVSGHDQNEHGKFEPDGTAYCGLCKTLDKRARRDPSVPRPARARPATLQEAFAQHAEPVDDGHVRWTGSTSHTTPTVWFGGTTHSAYKVAFRLHHDREPDGLVTSGCDVPHCVAGGHVEDQPMRQRKQQEERRERRLDRLYAGIFRVAA